MIARVSLPVATARLTTILPQVFDVAPDAFEVVATRDLAGVHMRMGSRLFVVALVRATGVGRIGSRAAELVAAKVPRGAIRLLVVPFMSDAAARAVRELELSWVDLSGNAHVVAPGMRVIIRGQPNFFRSAGRPANAFAPKSSRVTRYLLIHFGRTIVQRDVAREVGLAEGFVSTIVARLEQEAYVARVEVARHGGKQGSGDPEGSGASDPLTAPSGARGLRVTDPLLLLDAWRDQYDFQKHAIFEGHIAARSADALVESVSQSLRRSKAEYALTGLAAAWRIDPFAMFRTATFFLREPPTETLKRSLGFREDPRGANVRLVVPNDEGVFFGASDREGVRCVHPVQTYVDLKEPLERSAEAAEHLRPLLFTGKKKRG